MQCGQVTKEKQYHPSTLDLEGESCYIYTAYVQAKPYQPAYVTIAHSNKSFPSSLLARGNFQIQDHAIQQQEELTLPLLSLNYLAHRKPYARPGSSAWQQGRLDRRANTASIILMDPVSLLGRRNFISQRRGFPQQEGQGGGKGERPGVQLWGLPTGGRGAHKSKGRKKCLKAKMVQVHK